MTNANNLIYDVEPNGIAVLTFETPSSRGKGPQFATVRARFAVRDEDGDERVDATYLSHEGDATEADIDYALRCIETNSFAS